MLLSSPCCSSYSSSSSYSSLSFIIYWFDLKFSKIQMGKKKGRFQVIGICLCKAAVVLVKATSILGRRLQSLVLDQPFSIFLPWRNPWNNFQVSGNPYIKIITSTAHGTLAWSVSCRCNNTKIIVNALLSREWYFSVDLFILANKFKKRYFLFNHDLPRNPCFENLC
jgi:hypothetical protein